MIRRLLALIVGALAVMVIGITSGLIDTPLTQKITDTATSAFPLAAAATAANSQEIGDLISSAQVVDSIGETPGYERSCRKGKACVFGPAWTDDTDADLSHNGCDTRNDILKEQLSDVKTDPKSWGCKVIAGRLDPDPYTGTTLELTKARSGSSIEIDHIFPLELAWNSGAAQWSLARRATFANDPHNLLAVDGGLNSGKGSKGIGQWLPPNPSYLCEYITRYLQIATTYELPISVADRRAAERNCLTS